MTEKAHRSLMRMTYAAGPAGVAFFLAILTMQNGQYRDIQLVGAVTLFSFAVILGVVNLIRYLDWIGLIEWPIEGEDEEEEAVNTEAVRAEVSEGNQIRYLKWKFPRHEWRQMLDAFSAADWQFKKETLQQAGCFNTERLGFSYSTAGALGIIREEFMKVGWLDERDRGWYLNDVGKLAIRRAARE